MESRISAIALSLTLVCACVQEQGGPIVFTHLTVIDGTGAPARADQNVLVRGEQITAIGSPTKVPIPFDAREVDASGKFMIPGLWDTHVHTRYEGIDHLRLFLANGVTTVRDMASPWEHFERIKLWRLEIEAGRRVGPKILASGPLLDGPGSFWSHAAIVEDPESGRALVRRLKEERADFVKVYNRPQSRVLPFHRRGGANASALLRGTCAAFGERRRSLGCRPGDHRALERYSDGLFYGGTEAKTTRGDGWAPSDHR